MNIKELWKVMQTKKQAIPSFNFSTADVALTAARIAKKYNHYCLLSTSEREAGFLTIEVAAGIVHGLQKAGYPVFLNLDHGKSIDVIKSAIDNGYDCIHFDGSKLSLAENIKTAQMVVELCSTNNISVEGEVGEIGGSSTMNDESSGKSIFTDPVEAVNFVQNTKVNLLALSFGSYHGITSVTKTLNFELLGKIKSQVDTPFVLHGGSGITGDQITNSINNGVVKINFNTELRLNWSEGIREYQKNNPNDIVPVNSLTWADERVGKIIEEKIKLCINNL